MYWEGARDRASAAIKCLPGTWEIVESNHKRRIRTLSILGGISSRFSEPSSRIRGL